MFFISDNVILNEDQQKLIDFVVESENPNFPFFVSRSTKNRKAFVHNLMLRNLIVPGDEGNIRSPYYNPFYNIFKEFCDKHNIKVKKVLRAAVNYAIHYKEFTGIPHVDHDFDHCNFLMYLTDCKGGETIIYDDEGSVVKSISPDKFKAVVFPGQIHSVAEFEPGEDRIVLVFTFIKD